MKTLGELERKTCFQIPQILNKISSVYSCFDENPLLNAVHISVVPIVYEYNPLNRQIFSRIFA